MAANWDVAASPSANHNALLLNVIYNVQFLDVAQLHPILLPSLLPDERERTGRP